MPKTAQPQKNALLARYKLFFFASISCIVLALSLLFPSSATAQSIETSPPSYTLPNTNPDVPHNQHTLVQSLFIELYAAGICQMAGIDIINPEKGCLGIDHSTGKIGYTAQNDQPGGLIGMTTAGIGAMYYMPVHTGNYVNYLANNFGITKNTYAQARAPSDRQGFEQLDPLIEIWKVFRNLAYLGMALFFVFIGLGIMLRIKIDPRTVMSIQNQIPKVVIALILVTFSYAIVGALVDLMWTTTYIGLNLTGQVQFQDPNGATRTSVDTGRLTRDLLNSPIGFYNETLANAGGSTNPGGVTGVSAAIAGTAGDLGATLLSPWQEAEGTCNWAGLLGNDFRTCVRGGIFNVLKYIFSGIGFFIVILAILVVLFRIWFMLLRSFAYILIYTTLGPLYILMGVFPGSGVGFGSWIRGLLANLTVFPVTVLILTVSRLFMSTFHVDNDVSAIFTPPLIGNPNATTGFGYLVGFAILLIAPEMINMLRDAFKAQPNKYIFPAIQGGIGRGAGMATPIIGGGWSRLTKVDQQGGAQGALAQWSTRNSAGPTAIITRPLRTALRFASGVRKDADGQRPWESDKTGSSRVS